MAATQNINVDLVTNYLMMAASENSGVPVSEIVGATALNKATIYRIIRNHPAIKKIAAVGSGSTLYWIDLKVLGEWKSSQTVRRFKLLSLRYVHEAFRKKWLNRPWGELLRQSTQPLTVTDNSSQLRNDYLVLSTAAKVALSYQQGGEGLTLEQITACRIKVEELMDYHLKSYLYLESIKNHPRYADDEHYWAIWPLDESGIE